MRAFGLAVLFVLGLLTTPAKASAIDIFAFDTSDDSNWIQISSLDFGKVKVGETASLTFQPLLIPGDDSHPHDLYFYHGQWSYADSLSPPFSHTGCDEYMYLYCPPITVTFSPTKPGKAKTTLTIFGASAGSTCMEYYSDDGPCSPYDEGFYFVDEGWLYLPVSGIGVPAVSHVPIPSALPLLATGIGAVGFMGWYRRRTAGTR